MPLTFDMYVFTHRVPTLTGKVCEFGLYFSRSGKVLEFHRNIENRGKIGYFIAGQGSFVVPTSDSAERLM